MLLGGAPPPLPGWAVIAVITCPDCNAVATDYHLTHERSCPLGLAIDERQVADRRWFEAHPYATEYRRAPHWSEIAELKMAGWLPGLDCETTGRVLVSQLAPGVRVRNYHDVLFLHPAVTR